MSMVTVIGRGHSGTRAMSHTLSASGVYMGAQLNNSGDLIPPEDMYEACRVFARYVEHRGGLEWDFSRVLSGPVDPAFTRLIESFLASVLSSTAEHRGWKIPETTLCFPWIQRMFPDIHYIYWVRDPRDCVLGAHITDDLTRFGVPYDKTDDVHMQRVISWKYQSKLVDATPKPKRWIKVRFEDFVLHQQRELDRLSAFLGYELKPIPVRPEAVGRWQKSPENRYELFAADLEAHGYPPTPAGHGAAAGSTGG